MRSVRARTTALAALVVAAALVVGAVGLLVTLRASLVRSDDGLSRARVQDLASLVESGSLPVELRDTSDDGVGQVVDGSGHVVAASRSISGRGPISDWHPGGERMQVRTLHGVPDDSETETYRVWALEARGRDGPVTIYVGTSLESVSETITTLRTSLVIGVPVLLLVLVAVTWSVIGRALRPVDEMRSEVAAISHEDLSRRVEAPRDNDEVGRLAVTMNDMLGRLEAASLREREFVADASHELQSPLASLRAQLEVALTYPDHTEWAPLARELLAESAEMEALVRDLLFLSREDARQGDPRAHVDLDDIVLEEAERLRASTTLTIDTALVSAGPVLGRRSDLARLVRNLLENAVAHAVSTVTLRVDSDDGATRLVVGDDGPGVALADRSRVFERFGRGDSSRDRISGGSGLGLAIARKIAERHGGTLGIEVSSVGRGTEFVLRIPIRD